MATSFASEAAHIREIGHLSVPDLARATGANATTAQVPLAPGQSQQLVLYRKGDCTPTRQKHCANTTIAIQVHSLLSSEAVTVP